MYKDLYDIHVYHSIKSIRDRLTKYLEKASPELLSEIGEICFGQKDGQVIEIKKIAEEFKFKLIEHGGEA